MIGGRRQGHRTTAEDRTRTVRARKRFGQHFLAADWARRVVEAIAPAADDVFLEIGAGQGALTRPLAARAKHVVAVEIDRDLAAALADSAPRNVSIITGDILALDAVALVREWAPATGLRVAGNLPYNISTPTLFKLIDLHERTALLRDATVMLQREVVERLSARTGTREYGVLTVMVRLHADVTNVLALPPGAFRPAPKVRSAVARVSFTAPKVTVRDPAGFGRLVAGLFSQRRKTVVNALKPLCREPGQAARIVEGAGIDPRRRPETLDLPELAAIADLFAGNHRAVL